MVKVGQICGAYNRDPRVNCENCSGCWGVGSVSLPCENCEHGENSMGCWGVGCVSQPSEIGENNAGGKNVVAFEIPV